MATNTPNNQHMVLSFMTVRKVVGWLGMSLPPILLVGSLLLADCPGMQDSISHYYFTVTGDLFVGTLCAVSLFLFTYKGYNSKDNIFTNAAGLFALGVAFFATHDNSTDRCSIVEMDAPAWRPFVHYGSAALFFLTLAYISLFLFTKSKGTKTPEKIKRNRIYRACALIMVACLLLIALTHLLGWEQYNSTWFKIVFYLETIALWAFGFSWLTKGEFLLKDEE